MNMEYNTCINRLDSLFIFSVILVIFRTNHTESIQPNPHKFGVSLLYKGLKIKNSLLLFLLSADHPQKSCGIRYSYVLQELSQILFCCTVFPLICPRFSCLHLLWVRERYTGSTFKKKTFLKTDGKHFHLPDFIFSFHLHFKTCFFKKKKLMEMPHSTRRSEEIRWSTSTDD